MQVSKVYNMIAEDMGLARVPSLKFERLGVPAKFSIGLFNEEREITVDSSFPIDVQVSSLVHELKHAQQSERPWFRTKAILQLLLPYSMRSFEIEAYDAEYDLAEYYLHFVDRVVP